MAQRYQGGILGVGFNPLQAPNAPTIGAATAGNQTVSVAFTAPANVGGSAISTYAVRVSPGNFSATGSASPISVSGLTNNTAYTFSVAALNSYGPSPYSGTVSATPVAPPLIQDLFSTTLYTGNTVNFSGGGQTITTGVNMASRGGLVWCKSRSAVGNNVLCDVSDNIGLYSNLTNQKFNGSLSLAQYYLGATSTGFNLPADNNVSINTSGVTYASWSFCKAAKFFDMVPYTGDGQYGRQISHNLQTTPGFVIIKRTDSTGNWYVACYDPSLSAYRVSGASVDFALNLKNGSNTGQGFGNNYFTSTVVNLAGMLSNGDSDPTQRDKVNANGASYLMYLFAHDPSANGLIQCGTYASTGQVTLGWQPQWLMIKSFSDTGDYTGDWRIFDSKRGVVVGDDQQLFANSDRAENSSFYGTAVVFNSTGFLVESQGAYSTTFYVAIRNGPMS